MRRIGSTGIALSALAAFATLALAALLAAVPAGAQREILVWHAYRGDEKAAFEKVVEQYNRAQQGVRVSSLAVPYDAFADKITAAVPRGRGPDVFIYAQDRLGGWIAAGNTVEPLDFFLDDQTRGRYLGTTLQAMTYQGNVYGLPLNFKVITLIYNKKMIQTPPRTTGEMLALARKHTNAAAGRFGLAYWYSDFYYHAPLMNAFGGGVFDGRKPTLNSPANVKSVETLTKWLATGVLPAEPSVALLTALFNEERSPMVLSGPWFLGEVRNGIDVGLALLPTVDEAGGRPMRPWMTVEGVFVAAPSRNKDAAFAFAKYLTDVPALKVMALEGRQSPANKGAYTDPQIAGDPVLKAFRQQVENAIPMPNLPEMTMVWSPATTAMNKVVKKSATPKAALDAAQKEVVERIARLRGS